MIFLLTIKMQPLRQRPVFRDQNDNAFSINDLRILLKIISNKSGPLPHFGTAIAY
jgi:hypothetical protein